MNDQEEERLLQQHEEWLALQHEERLAGRQEQQWRQAELYLEEQRLAQMMGQEYADSEDQRATDEMASHITALQQAGFNANEWRWLDLDGDRLLRAMRNDPQITEL